MKRFRIRVALCVVALAMAAIAAAQTPSEPTRIPLSSYTFHSEDSKAGVYEREVDEGTFRISFSDLVPKESYDIFWHKLSLVAPAFTLPNELGSFSTYAALSPAAKADPCAVVFARAREVWDASDEPQVAQRLGDLRQELAGSTCADAAAKKTAEAAIAATRWKEVIEVKIEAGTILKVTVLRKGQRAVFVFKGPPPSRFSQTYGFSYLRDEDEEFFTEEIAEGQHVIRKKTRRSDWEPAGLLLLNYRLGGPWPKAADLAVHIAAALSFDGEDPSVGLGLNFTLANNLGLVVGYGMTEETRLRGEYRPGPDGTILEQAIASDQLVDDEPDETYFIGLSLNLSSNPFKKKQAETTTQQAKDGAK